MPKSEMYTGIGVLPSGVLYGAAKALSENHFSRSSVLDAEKEM